MSMDIHSESPVGQLAEAAGDVARRTADAAKETVQRTTAAAKDVTGAVKDGVVEVADATKEAAGRATEVAKDIYHSAELEAGETLATCKDYIRRNPVSVVLGSITFGVAIGCMLMIARRKPTFSERYADEPLAAVREAILGAIAPVTQRIHQGCDSARDGAGDVLDRMHRLVPGRADPSFSDQIARIGNNLKFW
jgi:ElaB/YqjD/DUF883 family membrane-anchored ribosome-binding protein